MGGCPPIVTLEERIVKAKSSMVASIIPKSPIYHGNRDVYVSGLMFDFLYICCYL
jgi:hypothetical protein